MIERVSGRLPFTSYEVDPVATLQLGGAASFPDEFQCEYSITMRSNDFLSVELAFVDFTIKMATYQVLRERFVKYLDALETTILREFRQ